MNKLMDKSSQPLIEHIYVLEGTVNSLTDLEEGAGAIELVEYLEEHYPDSTVFMDKNIESLFEYLYEAGFNNQQIIKMSRSHYGHYTDFTYYKDLDLYIMEVGTN